MTGIARRYLNEENVTEKCNLRNSLFVLILPWMKRWILSNCTIFGRDITAEEVTSLSWDCFVFCLERFKPDGPIDFPKHFYQYTKFCLMMHASSIRKRERQLLPLEETDCSNMTESSLLYPFFDLINFRTSLPEEYQSLLDEVMTSIVTSKKHSIADELGKGTVKRHRYLEAKKILAFVVKFFISSH